jgi:hypothetical protein
MADSLRLAWEELRHGAGIELFRNIVERSLLPDGPRCELEPDLSKQGQQLHCADLGKRAALELGNRGQTDACSCSDFELG